MIKTGNRNFWIAQLTGWGLFGLSNFLVQSTLKVSLEILIINCVFPMVTGLIVTTGYRSFIKNKNWRRWDFGKMLLLIFGSTFLLTTFFVGIIFGILIFVLQVEDIIYPTIFSNFMIAFIIMLAWNMIYFCVHYFNNWNQAEIEKWKLAAEMKDAQLGSLKSQINPHFVF